MAFGSFGITLHFTRVFTVGAPGVLGIWGECLFIFRELGSTGIFLGDLGSNLIILGDIGSLAKKQKKKKK